MKYLNKKVPGSLVEFSFELDSNYETGTTVEDYENGCWIILTSEQEQFHTDHPDATWEEVIRMELSTTTEASDSLSALDTARISKIDDIKNQDCFSNKFFVSMLKGGTEVANVQLWIDKDLRNSLLNVTLPALKSDGETTTKLWSNTMPPASIDVPIDWAMSKIPLLEIYAKRTYDKYCSNLAAVYAATTVEEVEAIDVATGYPMFLTFELNLDV